jgi:YbbR domain-containing protein
VKLERTQRHTLKIISIFFAVSLWFYVLNSEPIELDRKMNVEFILPKGYAIASQTERQLNLKLKGSKAFIGNVFSKEEKITVDLNPYFKKYGKHFKVAYHPSQITVPFGVDVLEISPKESAVELDRLVQMELPINVQYIGSVPYDRKFIEVGIEPSNIMISGPIEVIRKVSRISSDPINLSSIEREEGTINLPLEELDPRLKFEEKPKIKLRYKVQLVVPKRSK